MNANPYPRFLCRLIAIKDWIAIMLVTKSMHMMKLAAPPERWTILEADSVE